MKPAPFEYHRPGSVDDAVALLAELGDGAKVLAGGQSLVPLLSLRLAYPDHLVDIGRIPELVGVEQRDAHLWIGAGTTQTAVEHHPEVAAAGPLLTRATPLIGHFQVRNRGTVGGSIAHADPAAEYPAVLLALDGDALVTSLRGTRTIAAADLFTGLWSTTIAEDELLVGVRLPVWTGRCGFAVEELARRHGDFAVAGAAVALEVGADDRVARCGIGLIAMGSTPLRATDAESALVGRPIDEMSAGEVGRLATEALADVPSDLQGSDRYRRRVGAAMVARAWAAAAKEATGG